MFAIYSRFIHKMSNLNLILNELSLDKFDSINKQAELEFYNIRLELFVSLNELYNKNIFLFLYDT